jgi:hypothetical protein
MYACVHARTQCHAAIDSPGIATIMTKNITDTRLLGQPRALG